MEEKDQYNGFISYVHAHDKELARAVKTALEKLGAKKYLLQFKALKIFLAESNLLDEDGLGEGIINGLKKSDYLILFARPETMDKSDGGKNWVEEEIKHWLRLKHPEESESGGALKDIKVVVCVTGGHIKLADTDFDWDATNCIHPLLKGKFKKDEVWVDFREIIQAKKAGNNKVFTLSNYEFKIAIAKISGKLQNSSAEKIIGVEQTTLAIIAGIAATIIAILLFLAISLYNSSNIANSRLKDFRVERLKQCVRNGTVYADAQARQLFKSEYIAADSIAKLYPTDSWIQEQMRALDSVGKRIKEAPHLSTVPSYAAPNP